MTNRETICYLHNPEDDKCCSEKDVQAYKMAIKALEQESIPYLMHKEMGVPLLECQKAYDIAMEYLRSQGKLKG